MSIPKLYSLSALALALGDAVTVKSLRAEVHAGRLRAVRVRPGCNAKILIREEDALEWLEKVAAKRQLVPSPYQVGQSLRGAKRS